MKKIFTFVMSIVLALSIASQANASVGSVSVMPNLVNKSILNMYVKNNNNRDSAKIVLELQKDGKTILTKSITVGKSKQVRIVFNLSSSGVYSVKYTDTSNNKWNKTQTFKK